MYANYVSHFIALLTLLLVLLSAPGYALADDTVDAKQLNTIYEVSGIHSQLSWALSVVQEESKKARLSCSTADKIPDIDKMLVDILSVQELRESFLNELKDRLNPTQRKEVVAWASSTAGQKIFKAEADSASNDEADFDTMYKAYQNSDTNSEARTERMSTMLSDTGAVYFISAINTEISALVSMASVCSTSSDDIASAEAVIKEERSGEALYRAFMRQELVVPANVIYQNVPDEDIDAYIEFANSDAGEAYFTALIKGVRAVLSERVDGLKLALEPN